MVKSSISKLTPLLRKERGITSMKSFSESLGRRGTDGITAAIDAVDNSMGGGVHNLQNPEVLQRINAVIGDYANDEFIDPFQVVRAVREHLRILGVGFMTDSFSESSVEDGTVIEIPLFRWGGRYGRLTDESAEITSDDGISHEGRPLSVRFGFMQLENNKFNVVVKII
jgi:hypothetical protein